MAADRVSCPFCGAKGAELVVVFTCTPEVDNGCFIQCGVCLAGGPIVAARSEPKAWRAWARREGAHAR
jgi:hypothetical protein